MVLLLVVGMGILCWNGREDGLLLVAVTSSPEEFEQRAAIRETWASVEMRGAAVVKFFIGVGDALPNGGMHNRTWQRWKDRSKDGIGWESQLEIENRLYRDLVLLSDVTESYSNLTLKTLAIFQWMLDQRRREKYVLKVDTDTYVRLKPLQALLKKSPREKFYLGRVMPFGTNAPYRKGTHKWVISVADYPALRWPPYCFGFAYVVSADLAAPLAACLPVEKSCTQRGSYLTCVPQDSRCPFRPIRFEDVTVGGILLHHLTGMKRIDLSCRQLGCVDKIRSSYLPWFQHNQLFINEPWAFSRKDCRDDFLVIHRVTGSVMRRLNGQITRKEPIRLCES